MGRGGLAPLQLGVIDTTENYYSISTDSIDVKLVLFDAMTAGAGILLNHRGVLGEEFKNCTVAVAMIGDHNASIFVVAKGVFQEAKRIVLPLLMVT